ESWAAPGAKEGDAPAATAVAEAPLVSAGRWTVRGVTGTTSPALFIPGAGGGASERLAVVPPELLRDTSPGSGRSGALAQAKARGRRSGVYRLTVDTLAHRAPRKGPEPLAGR